MAEVTEAKLVEWEQVCTALRGEDPDARCTTDDYLEFSNELCKIENLPALITEVRKLREILYDKS